MAGFRPDAGPGLPGDILKKKKEEEEQNVTQKYSPVAAPETSLKNTEKKITNKNSSGSGKKSGSATGGGKAAGRSPVVFGAYSPVAGVPDPLERLRNRISGGTKEAADSYRGGAARRRTNVPAAAKTVDPVTAEYLSRISPVARTLEKHRLSSGSDFDKILSFNRVLARQEKEDRDNAYENALLKQFGSFSSSQLRERIEQNERAIGATYRPDVAAGYERQNKILARWMLEKQAKEKADSFLSLKNNADFKQIAAERKAGLLDSDFKYINNIDNERSKAKAARGLNAGISGVRFDNLEQLTAEETEIYNYLHNTQGNRAAKEYLDYLEPDLNARRAKKDSARAKAFAKEHPHLSDVFSVLEAPARAVGSAAAVIDDIAGAANGKKVDVNSVYRAGSNAVGAAREVTNKKWEDKTNVNLPVIGNLGSFLHGAVLSGLDSAMMMLTGGAAGGALGKTAQGAEAIAKAVVSVGLSSELASNEIVANKAKGYSDLRAIGLGLANGLTEALSEKFSLDVIMKGSPKGALAAMGRSFLAEGSEEAGATAANMAIDAMVNGSDSDIKKRIAEYKQAGEGDFGAVSKALADFIVPEFLAGGLSGSAMGGVHYGMSGKSQKAGGKNGVTFDDIVNAGKEQRENVQNGTGAKNGADDGIYYLIQQNDKGQYVKADRNVISGNDPSVWKKQIKNYIDKEIRNGKDVRVYAADGDILTITEDTSGKARFRNEITLPNGTKRPMTNAEFAAKLRAEAHIDELSQVSKRGKKTVPDTKNHSFAKDGFNYRTAYFEDVDGQYYRITMSVGINGEIKTVYNVGKMKEALYPGNGKTNASLEVQPSSGSKAQRNQSVDDAVTSQKIIPQTAENYNPEMQKNVPNIQTGKTGDAFDDIINIGKEGTNQNAKNGADNDLLFSINYDKNNVPFVEVDNDVLAGLTQKEKQAKVKEILKDRFSQGVSVGNEQIQITKKSRDEFLNSKYTNTLKRKQPSVYDDKLRSSDNLDEIVKASRDYVGEGLKHPRKDSIREFARGTVNLRVGGKDYSADVVVGTKSDDSLVFYDLINFKPAKINERAPVTRMVNKNDSTNSLDWNALSDSSIPQTTENYNPEMQKNSDENGPVYSVNPEGAEQRESQAPAMQENEAAVGGKAQEASFGAFRRVVEALGYKVIDAPRAERIDAMLQKYQNDSESRTAFWPGQQGSRSVPGGEKTLWDKGRTTERQEVFPTGETDRSGVWPDVDGYVDYKLGEVYINPNAQNPQNVVMKHELTHVLEHVSTEYLKQVSDYIKTTLPDVWERTQKHVIDKYDRLGIDVSKHLESETMAEIASEFSTDKAINRYGTSARFCRNISLWFSYMAKKIKSVFGDLTVADKLEIAAYKWEQALKQAKMGTNSGTDGVVYTLSFNGEKPNGESKAVIREIKEKFGKISSKHKFDVKSDDNVSSFEKKSGYVLDIFNKQGNIAHNKTIGDVELVQSGAKSTILHGYGNVKLAAVKAIKSVIENGDIVGFTENYNNSGVNRYILASVGKIDGKDAVIGVVIKSYPNQKFNNKFYLHEAEIIEADSSLMTAPQLSVDTVNKSASDNTVPQVGTSVNNNFMQNEEKDAKLDFLLAGEKAKTHDPAALDKAKRLSAFGETPRQIWKETGWVKGQEGKWRFELDDSKMTFRKKDGKICDVLRISELNFQSMTEGLSDAESDEFLRLRQAASRGELSAPLSDVISYDLLFEAYPALKDVFVKSDFHAIGMGKAAYDPGTKTIYLSPQANGAKLRQTLLHEIQHAVQDEEGFSFGSSPDYWRERSGISAKEAERLYENTAGEIEARDVERRADLTEEERRETFPASAEPNDDVVFAGEETGNGGINYAHGFGGLTQYTEKEKKNWKNSKTILVYSNLEQFKEFVNRVLGNVDIEKKMYFGKIPENVASRILHDTGIDVSDLNVSLKGYEIRKILLNSHGDKRAENLRGQEPVNVNDLLNIPSIITQPDRISLTEKQYEGKPALLFEKNINGKNYVLTYVSRKHHDLAIQTMYKNRSLSSAENANAFSFTSETTAGTASTDSVSQGETSVNSYSMQTQENNAPERTISQLADELEEIDRLLDNEDLSDEEYRRLDRKSRKLEREISILTARRAAQTAQTARTAGNSGVPFSGGNLLEDSGQQGAADSGQQGAPSSPEWFRPGGKLGDVADAVEEYRETGNSDGIPTRQSARQSQKYYVQQVDSLGNEIAEVEAALLGNDLTALERENAEARRAALLMKRREAVSKTKVLSEVLEILDEIDTLARPNHKWVGEISADLSDKRNVLKFGTYGMNDFERNVKHFFGKKHFKTAYEKILRPLYESKKAYAKGVAAYSDLIYESVVKGLGIQKGTRMSAAVQWLGEGEKPVRKKAGSDLTSYSYDDCVAEFGKEKAERIKKAAEIFRNCYDDLIDDVNATRKMLYPNNPEKLIKKRKDYFRHFQEESNNLQGLRNTMQNHLGIDPTLVGVSEHTRPKTKWQSMAQERTGNKTTYDAVGGFLDYLPQAEYAIHIDPNIVNIRSLAFDLASAKAKEGANGNPDANGFIRYLQKYANRLAGKTTSAFDRALADSTVGRPAIAALSWFNNRVKANAVLGNFSSVIAQLQNITNITGKIKRETDILKGAAQALAGVFGDKKIRGLYEESGFLQERFLDKKLNRFEKKMSPTRWAAAVLGIADEIGTRITWNAAYNEGKRVLPENPVQYADDLTRSSVAGRGIGETPLMFESQLGKLFLPFRVEVMNTVNVWQDILFDDSKDTKVKNVARNVLKFTEYAVACAVVNALIAGLKSDEFDPIDDVEEGLKKAQEEAGGDVWKRAGLSVLRPVQELYGDWADGYGNGVGADFLHDVVSGLSQAKEEAGGDAYKRAGLSFLRPVQNLAGDVASNHPLSSAALGILGLDSGTTDFLFNGSVYNAGGAGMPAASTIANALKKLGKGEAAAASAEVLKSFALPWGGSQADKTVRGLYEFYNGATTKNAYERMWNEWARQRQDRYEPGSEEAFKKRNGTLKYLVEPTGENFVKSALFGPSSFGGEQEAYYSDKTRRMDEDETEKILSQDGHSPRKITFDEILAEHVYNAEKDDRKQQQADDFFDGKDVGNEQGPGVDLGDETAGSELYAMYLSGDKKTIPFRNIPLDLSVTIDEKKYEAHLAPEDAKKMEETLSNRLKERFEELDRSEKFSALSVKEKESVLNSFVGYEVTRVKAEHFLEIGDMTQEAFDAYDLSYRRSVAKKEREIYVNDGAAFVAYNAVNVEKQFVQYAPKVTGETRRQAKKYAEFAALREPDEVDLELLRVSNLTGSDINVGGNPSGILSYSYKKQSFTIDMPDTEVYALMDTVEQSCRAALKKEFQTARYKNADAVKKKDIIAAVKADVRKSVKEKYKKKYKSIKVDKFEEIRNMK